MTINHPQVSRRTRWVNPVFRVLRLVADIMPIRVGSMRAVNAVMALPTIMVARAIDVDSRCVGGLRIDTVTHRDVVDPARTILHIHGGGFVFGSTKSHRLLAAEMSKRCGSRVVLFDYRLLTEHSVEAALDDCLAAYLWTQHRYADAPVVVSGDSAGGNLMVSLLSRLESGGVPLPLAAIGMSAWLDPDYVHPKNAARDSFFSVRFAARAARLAQPGHAIRPLDGLLPSTPMLLQCGATEPIRPSNETLVERLTANGVSAALHVWEKQPHVFQALAPFVPESIDAIDAIGTFIAGLPATDQWPAR